MIKAMVNYEITCDECGMTKEIHATSPDAAAEYLKTATEWTVVVKPGRGFRDVSGNYEPPQVTTYCPLHTRRASSRG